MKGIDCLRQLRANGWTWKELAAGVGMSETYLITFFNRYEDKLLSPKNEMKVKEFYRRNRDVVCSNEALLTQAELLARYKSKLRKIKKIRQLFWA